MEKENNCIVAPFQNRRYDPHFRKVREIIDSGVLGEIAHVRLFYHNFTRRGIGKLLKSMGVVC